MVKIITDSSTLYTIEEGRKAGIEAIPLCVSIGDWHGRDLQMDMAEFYSQILAGKVPTSSQPPIGDVLDVYEKYKGLQMINIAMADGLSGTFQSAQSAREMADNGEDIVVFNSRTLCGPHRYMAEQARNMAEEGRSREEILKWLETAAGRTESFLIPQDFSFLRRGGRLTPLAGAIGSLLRLKPILHLTGDGRRLDKFGVKRTMSSAVGSILKHIQGKIQGGGYRLYIAHADAPKEAEGIRRLFAEALPELEIHVLELSPAFVTQGGPQCVAIQYIELVRDEA